MIYEIRIKSDWGLKVIDGVYVFGVLGLVEDVKGFNDGIRIIIMCLLN